MDHGRIETTDVIVYPRQSRVVAVDVLRGFAVLILIAEVSMQQVWDAPQSWNWLLAVRQLLMHAEWHGFQLVDFGFPGYVILMGISLSLSASRAQQNLVSRGRVLQRIVVRSVALFCLGVFHDGGFLEPWPQFPLAGVLQRLSLCYFFSALAVHFSSARSAR